MSQPLVDNFLKGLDRNWWLDKGKKEDREEEFKPTLKVDVQTGKVEGDIPRERR